MLKKSASKNIVKMSQDIVADALNMIKNSKGARRESLKLHRISNLLIEILKIMRQKEIIKKYKIDPKDKSMEVSLGNFTECKAIKPRFTVKKDEIEKYIRRYLPARDTGTIVVSTSKGIMSHEDAIEAGLGGALLAYFY